MKLSHSPQIAPKIGVAFLAISLWAAWPMVTLYPFAGESSEMLRLTWYIALTLTMTSVGVVGMCIAKLSSNVWNLLQAMSLTLPLHLLALMAESRDAIICLSASAVPTIVLSLVVLREGQLERLNNRELP